MKKDYEKISLYGLLLIVVAILIFSVYSFIAPLKSSAVDSVKQVPTMSKMSLTSYDKELARKMMDKNNDGKCDACGMPVEMCIDSGQMQCNMGSESTIGVLGMQHIHSDFKVYINGKTVDFARPDYYMKSSFIHVDDNQNKEDASGVIHMHATGVPLWIFFESMGMEFEKDCFTVDSGVKYCNNAEKSLKFYVNGKENIEFGDYIFNDLDKILISYSDKDKDTSNQLNTITDYAKNH